MSERPWKKLKIEEEDTKPDIASFAALQGASNLGPYTTSLQLKLESTHLDEPTSEDPGSRGTDFFAMRENCVETSPDYEENRVQWVMEKTRLLSLFGKRMIGEPCITYANLALDVCRELTYGPAR
jgi:hypothetical protein